jgi:CubicO group peptidase (beta-lactamase class C family)
MKRKWLIRAALLIAAAVVAALAYAPYLPQLLWEGYPGATWPARGYYADIDAGHTIELPAAESLSVPDENLAKLFGDAEGRALLAARDGKVVMEHYAPGVSRETRLNSYSLAKSLIGALALKAVAEGRIAGRDAPLGVLLPELAGSRTGALPLCRLLDMRSGIVFEPGPEKRVAGPTLKDLEATKLNVFGPMARLHMLGLKSVEHKLVPQEPEAADLASCEGGVYSYQNVNAALVGEVLQRAYGKPLQDLLSEKIWKPAGAAPAEWRRYGSTPDVTPYCCIYARPMDWLAVAQYLLDNGKPGAPFLPEPLWRLLLGLDVPATTLHGGYYANFVYHNVLDRPGEKLQGPFAYFFGSRGQAVYLMPEASLAVVRFGGKIQRLHSTLYAVARSISAAPAEANEEAKATIPQREQRP